MSSSGRIALAGLFEPYSVVELYEVPTPGTLRAEAGYLRDKRRADEDGSVGFANLGGDRYIAKAYVKGQHLEVRCRALAPDEDSELKQPPIKANTNERWGTQNEVFTDPPPAEPHEDLEVGYPEGVESPILEHPVSAARKGAQEEVNPAPQPNISEVPAIEADNPNANPSPQSNVVEGATTSTDLLGHEEVVVSGEDLSVSAPSEQSKPEASSAPTKE